MASTNKTKNFNLSQFIQTDKPTFLGDYNTDMNKIDEALESNKVKSENNTSLIGNLQDLDTENKITLVGAINEVNENAKTGGDLKEQVNQLKDEVGDLEKLNTSVKDNLVNALNDLYNDTHPLIALYNSLRNIVTWQAENKTISINDLEMVSGTGTFEEPDNLLFNYTHSKYQFKLSGGLIIRNFSTETLMEFKIKNTGLDTFSNDYKVVGYARNNTDNTIYPLTAKIQNNVIEVVCSFSDSTPADYELVFIDAVRNV